MRLLFAIVLTASLVAGLMVATYGAEGRYFIDPPLILAVLGGAALFMLGCYPPRELGMWMAVGFGLRRSVSPEEVRRASQMCVVGVLALAVVAVISAAIGMITLLQNLSYPEAIGPALGIVALSPFYAALPALPLLAMWTQITRPGS